MLLSDSTDQQTLKRLVSLYRDGGMETEAIQVLNKFIEMNQDDVESWLELADIYLSKQNFTKALYCYEEIIATMPKNYLVNLRYAETLYSAYKTTENFDELALARKYFSHAAILKEDSCARALLGLV
jgi:tetratricopeptide (TPR) repeat protein